MPYFLSTADLVTGNSYLDAEHQKLIKLIDALIAACDSGASPGTVSLHVEHLLDFAQAHFAYEIAQMQRAACVARDAHVQDHTRLLRDLAALKLQLDSGQGVNCVETYHFLRAWLREHILTFDVPMVAAPTFAANKPQASG